MRNDRPVESGVFHSHPFYEIYYFHEGHCTYLIGDRIYVLKPGDLLLMNDLTLHCSHVHTDARYVRSIVHFVPGFLEQWLHPAVSAAVPEKERHIQQVITFVERESLKSIE
ncbi:AraC family ligand binding domain-containing protein [Paenibacillus sp. DMB20]|uniref:AraC family ligand binding domain-containing protein n=1 Tax=Paenibacillus sp. DMB20 TaxID=1642570 RepID=UPI0006276DAA|nr:AraC family ligand binding domain-containing protein [Paenibacillus sp. DMB20]KKO51268.1 hypothetical protein XI25_27660 [Paenibacillus sp. DMB20]